MPFIYLEILSSCRMTPPSFWFAGSFPGASRRFYCNKFEQSLGPFLHLLGLVMGGRSIPTSQCPLLRTVRLGPTDSFLKFKTVNKLTSHPIQIHQLFDQVTLQVQLGLCIFIIIEI